MMHLIIGGAKEAGKFLAAEFSKEDLEHNYSITVIDEDYKEIQSIHQQFNVATVCASIADFQILKQNIKSETRAFVACTEKEETNIISCILAHSLGIKNNIAVTYSAIYNQEKILAKYQKSGVRYIINTTKVLKEEIIKLANFASSIQINYFAKGEVVLYGFVVDKNFIFLNKFIYEITQTSFFLIGATSRSGSSYIPSGNWKIKEGDTLFVLFPKAKLIEFEEKFIVKKEYTKNIVIFGEQNLTNVLVCNLLQKNFIVDVICKDQAEQNFISQNIPKEKYQNCRFHISSALDFALQKKIIIRKNILFIALSQNEPDNLTACMLAKYLGVEKTIALVNQQDLLIVAQKMGVDVSLSKKAIVNRLVQQLIHYGDYSPDFTTVANTDIEVLSLSIKKHSPWVNLSLQEILFPQNSLVGIIINHKNKIIIPKGDTIIRQNDKLIFFTLPRNVLKLKKMALGSLQKI